MKTRHIKQQLNCELPEIEPINVNALEYREAPSQRCTRKTGEEAARLREAGLTVKEVAKQLGISEGWASLLSRRANPCLAAWRTAGVTNSRRKVIAEMRSAGCTYGEIGKALGISRQAVSEHVQEMKAQQQREKAQ